MSSLGGLGSPVRVPREVAGCGFVSVSREGSWRGWGLEQLRSSGPKGPFSRGDCESDCALKIRGLGKKLPNKTDHASLCGLN